MNRSSPRPSSASAVISPSISDAERLPATPRGGCAPISAFFSTTVWTTSSAGPTCATVTGPTRRPAHGQRAGSAACCPGSSDRRLAERRAAASRSRLPSLKATSNLMSSGIDPPVRGAEEVARLARRGHGGDRARRPARESAPAARRRPPLSADELEHRRAVDDRYATSRYSSTPSASPGAGAAAGVRGRSRSADEAARSAP